MAWLKGKKTYIIAAVLVALGIFKVVVGDMDVVTLLQSPELLEILAGLGLGALRAGVAK